MIKLFRQCRNRGGKVQMMHGQQTTGYYADKEISAVTLALGNGIYEMIVAIPGNGKTLSETAKNAVVLL